MPAVSSAEGRKEQAWGDRPGVQGCHVWIEMPEGTLGVTTGSVDFGDGGRGGGTRGGWFSFCLELSAFGQNTGGRVWQEDSKVLLS